MKGAQALIVAAIFGAAGVVLNYVYLSNKLKDTDHVEFLGVRADVSVQPGDLLQESHFEAVRVPSAHAGTLQNSVYLYQDRATVAGIRATRAYQGGDLIWRQDYRTPAPELKLLPTERLIWVQVDSRNFVPEMVDPGDQITFLVPTRARGRAPASVLVPPEEGAPAPVPEADPVLEAFEPIGPFRIGSLGNRLGSLDVMRANRQSPANERLVGIIVRDEGGKLEAKALLLQERLVENDYRGIGVILHPRETKD